MPNNIMVKRLRPDVAPQLEGVQLLAMKGALHLETLGLRRRGQSVCSILKAKFGFKGNSKKVYEQFVEHIDRFNAEYGFSSVK